MALRSVHIDEDPHVEYVRIYIEQYIEQYLKYLEEEGEGVDVFLDERIKDMWIHFCDYYKRRTSSFGLNPSYVNFKHNKELFSKIISKKKIELR